MKAFAIDSCAETGLADQRLLVSTFDAILLVTLSSTGIENVKPLVSGHGIYFGMSRSSGTLYVAARNLTIRREIRDFGQPTNTIEEWDLTRNTLKHRWTHESMSDLHQIRVNGRHLFVLSGRSPALLIFDRRSRSLMATINLDEYVPEDTRHAPPETCPEDTYHFNSLTFAQGRVLILAHNWNYGSFVLEFEMNLQELLNGHLRLLTIHRNLGFESHDVFLDELDGLYVLDSKGNALLCNGKRLMDFPSAGFPRGLAATSAFLFVASGRSSPTREGRTSSETRLMVIDRRTGCLAGDFNLGDHGNSCDVTLLHGVDMTDSDPGRDNVFVAATIDTVAAIRRLGRGAATKLMGGHRS
jgi:hypothetical protein